MDPTLLNSLLEQLSELSEVLQNQQSFTTKWLPGIVGIVASIVALIVGLLSFLSARQQIRTSREIAAIQMKSAEEISKSQLDNSKEITISQIKANLLVASRKEWIENLRKNISEVFYLANKGHTSLIATETRLPDEGDRIWQLVTYIELLLNPLEAEHKDFLAKQSRFISFCMSGEDDTGKWQKYKAEYLESAKKILKLEWNKVKSLT